MSRSAKLPANVLAESTEQDYVKWLNRHLAKATPRIVVNSLTENNVCNGVAIGLLLESIGDVKFNGLLLQPGTRVERLHNVHEVFSVLRRLNVRLDSVQPEDVINGGREAILQLLLSISSYFMLHHRARKQVNLEAEVRHFKSRIGASPSSSLRQTPSERLSPQSQPRSIEPSTEPASHDEDLYRPTYTHEIIGPTVHPGDQSGTSSPRSRSSMTIMVSGQRSPIAQKQTQQQRASFRNDYSPPGPVNPSQMHHVRSPREVGRNVAENGRPDYSHQNHLKPRADVVNAQNFNPISELSSLRNKLHDISRLITNDVGGVPVSNQPAVFSQRGVQTDSTSSDSQLERELKQAKQKIVELKLAYERSTEELAKAREENGQLSSALRNLRVAVRRSGSPTRDTPAETRAPTVLRSSVRNAAWDTSPHDDHDHHQQQVEQHRNFHSQRMPGEQTKLADPKPHRVSPHDPRSSRSPGRGNRYDPAEKLRDQFQPFVEQLASMRRTKEMNSKTQG